MQHRRIGQPHLAWIAAWLVGAAVLPSHGATLTVCSDGCDYAGLQQAHDFAQSGDRIELQQEVLTEDGIILVKDLHIVGTLSAPSIVQAADAAGIAEDRVFYVAGGIVVSMENLIVRHGVFAEGGGIFNLGDLTLRRVAVAGNRSTFGGGISVSGAAAALTLIESIIENNEATSQGGGIDCSAGTLQIERSTLAQNRAFEGGGLNNRDGCMATVRNSTVSMNVAPNGGAGMLNRSGSTLSVVSSTLAYNSLRGLQNNGATSTLSIRNSLLGNALTFDYQPGGNDCAVFLGATITDLGFNRVQRPNSCAFSAGTSVTGVAPGITPLGDFGGPTPTHALLAASGARNSGEAAGLSVDQRNLPRPQDGGFDVGAFEAATADISLPISYRAPVTADGRIEFAELTALDQRGSGYNVQRQLPGGALAPVEPAADYHRTYLGTLPGVPGAVVGTTYFAATGESYYHVIFEDGTEWVHEGGTTQVLTGALAPNWAGMVPPPGGAGDEIWVAEVGIDLPNDRLAITHGGNISDALAMIDHAVLSANLLYLRQAGIMHQVGRVILRASAADDPYAPLATHNQYLTTLINQWENVLPPSSHDLALVVRLDSAAGLAQVGRIGLTPGYSSNDATPRGDFSRPWRHEAGHNWSLIHFEGGTPEGPTFMSGNSLGRMSGPEQAKVLNFRDDGATDIVNVGSLPQPIPPNAGLDRALLSSFASGLTLDLLANDHDANGDALTLVSIEPLSELSLGGSMTLGPQPGTVIYTPPTLGAATSRIDRFRYRIRDATGLEALGYVLLRIVDFDRDGAYRQDFDPFANGTADFDDGSYIVDVSEGSAAAVVGQALELTPDQLGRNSGFTLPPQSLEAGFVASFRYRITSANTPADGFALNFGFPNATSLPSGGIGRFPSGLTLEWNTFAARGYHVLIDGVNVPGGFVPDFGLVDGNWHDVSISWNPTTGLTLVEDGVSVFTDLATTGFAPDTDAMLAFSALTIGLSQQVLIDDVVAGRDADADGVLDGDDTCPGWSNPGQGSVRFLPSILFDDAETVSWSSSVNWASVSGPFSLSADIGSYTSDTSSSGVGSSVQLPESPNRWILLRPDCAVGSFSTAGSGQSGDRDGALLP